MIPSRLPGHWIARTVTLGFVIIILSAFVSIDGAREQEAFNLGAIWLTIGTTFIYVLASLFILRREPAAGDYFFIRFGGVLLMLTALIAYTFGASILLGRVM